VSNAQLIRRNGYIRFFPRPDYFNVQWKNEPYPELIFHGWSGYGLGNNISDAAAGNCVFSRSSGKLYAKVLSLNFVSTVEVTPFSMKLETSIQLTSNVIDGDIRYDLEIPGTGCVIRSATEKVKTVLQAALGGVLSHEIFALQSATPYQPFMKIFSSGRDNTSDGINEYQGIQVTTVPDAVQNVQVKKLTGSLDITIFWEASFTLQGGLIYYRVVIDGKEGQVQFNVSSGSEFPFCTSLRGHEDGFLVQSTQTTVRGLRSSSLYEVRIAAFGANAAINLDPCPPPLSPFSMPILFETNVGQVPSPPHAVKVYEAGPYAIAVQWEFPEEPEGAIIEFIVELRKVTVSNEQSTSPYREFMAAVVERNHVFTSVSKGDFYVMVRARNERGIGLPVESPIVCVTSPNQGIGVPNITVTGLSESLATISWVIDKSFSNESQPKFSVLIYPNNDCRRGNASDGTDISSGIYNASRLHPFTAYSVCVWDSKLPLNTSSVSFFFTHQSAPMGRITVYDISNLMSHAARTDSVLLRWTPVDKPNGVIGYEIIVKQLEGLNLSTTSFSLLLDPNLLPPPRQNSQFYQWRVTGLEVGVGYNFTVRPYNLLSNASGNGTSISIFTFVGRPGPPTISRSYNNVTNTSITIRWNPPVKGNVNILSYAIALNAPDVNTSDGCVINQQSVSVSPQEGGLLEYTFMNLLPATSYVATVQAKSAAGYGETSLPFPVMTAPNGPCLSTNCSSSAICVPHSDSFQCFCLDGFIGDGHVCVEQSIPVIEVLSSKIHIAGLHMQHGDFLKLNNTFVTIQLLTPDGQLLQSERSPFQLHHVTGVTLYPVVFKALQAGVEYQLEYSFPIGSFVQTGKEMKTTQSSVPQSPPTVVSIKKITNITVDVSWQPPPHAFRNGPLTGYDILVNSLFTINGSFVSMEKTIGDITSMIIDGLLPFQMYEVRVAARTSKGRGPWSNIRSFRTESTTPGPPRIDHAVYVFNGFKSYIHVTWRYPTLPGGEITHFLISAWSGELLDDFSTVKATENALLLNVSLQHRARVQARSNSSHGTSRLSVKDVQSSGGQEERNEEAQSFELNEFQPAQLCHGSSYFESATVTSIAQSEAGNFSATVTWSKANTSMFRMQELLANVTYHVFSKRGEEDCKGILLKVLSIFNSSNTSGILSNLFPNSIYSVCIGVASTDSCTVFARTFVVTPQSVPGPVNSISVRSLTSESAELTWLPPVSLNGIIGYEVIVEESNNNSFLIEPSSLVTSDGNTTIGVLLSSLNGGKVYNITVRAYNLKRGDRGPVVSTNLTMKLGVPRPPKAVSAESNGPNSIDLHWSPSVSGGVTNYQITSVISNTENNRVPDYFVSHHVQLVNATTLKYTLRGLEPNTTYALWIKSMGLNTESEPSRVVFQKTES
jgi:hypothetical protein